MRFIGILLHGETNAVNPAQTGTKGAAHYELKVPAGKSADGSDAIDEGGGREEDFVR